MHLFMDVGHTRARQRTKKVSNVTCSCSARTILSVATSYNNIGEVYRVQGKYEEALVQHGRTLDIKIRVVGEDHMDVATSYNNIGVVYDSQEK